VRREWGRGVFHRNEYRPDEVLVSPSLVGIAHQNRQQEYAPDMTQAHHMSKPTEAGMARFSAVLDELSSERDVVKASMFGMPGIKRRGGKAFCGLYGDDMIFKLAGEDHKRALDLRGAQLFEPMAGRPMKAWVQVPPEHESRYGELARAAEASLES
jgi:hypothetical protein